jgi:capsular exopolysaccharide synthesis family protein
MIGKRTNPRSAQKDAEDLQMERSNLLSVSGNFYLREAYKTLRTNVTFSLADQAGCGVVIVTSALQSEGKSFTAVNLAISYAQAEQRVLLIDCDLRRPKINRLLSLSNPVGLTNLLLQPDLRDKAILHSQVSGLDVILSGDIPPNPSELLGSQRMKELLSDLRSQYDYIVLDVPPVNMVTDAVVLAPQSDGVIFVVRMNQTEKGALIRAVEQMKYTQVRILGTVLNGIDLEGSGYGYGKYRRKYGRYGRYGSYGYGGYGYGYGSGHHSDHASTGEMPL